MNWHPPPHRQDSAADTPTPDPRPPLVPGRSSRIQHRQKAPLKMVDCYVDDLVALAQLRRLCCVLFHCIDMVFRAPDDMDDEWKMDPISVKNFLKVTGRGKPPRSCSVGLSTPWRELLNFHLTASTA